MGPARVCVWHTQYHHMDTIRPGEKGTQTEFIYPSHLCVHTLLTTTIFTCSNSHNHFKTIRIKYTTQYLTDSVLFLLQSIQNTEQRSL